MGKTVLFTMNVEGYIVSIGDARKIYVGDNIFTDLSGTHLVGVAYPGEQMDSEILYTGSKDECESWLIRFYSALNKAGFFIGGPV